MEKINAADTEMSCYYYNLPEELIASHPLSQRDGCKLLVADTHGVIADEQFTNLPSLLPSDSLLVYNDTRVVKARLFFRKPEGASIEIFCLEPVQPAVYEECFSCSGPVTWRCLVGNAKKWKNNLVLERIVEVNGKQIKLSASKNTETDADGSRLVTFTWDNPEITFATIMDKAGVIPIPPYLNRESEESDEADYQTVFNRVEGSVAAPTAGLHFTPEILEALSTAGIERASVTLHVGAGTFRPVKSDTIGGHDMHSEFINVPRKTIEQLVKGKTVIAVGTTSVRTLESLYHIGCLIHQGKWRGEVPQWYPYSQTHPNLTTAHALEELLAFMEKNKLDNINAFTRIIITPGYTCRIVSGMVTNFHQPGSTLLLLVAAMIGPVWKKIYIHAVEQKYRFLSYGDACLFLSK